MTKPEGVPIPEFDTAADELQWLRDQYTLAINELMEYAKLIAAGGAEVERLKREVNVAHERMRTAEYRESETQKDIERLQRRVMDLESEVRAADFQLRVKATLDSHKAPVE